MMEITEEQWAAAEALGEELERTEPRASHASYDPANGCATVALTDGCTLVFPARAPQGLGEASDEDLGEVEVLGSGFGLHWETLDADFTVPGLLMGVFGARAFMDREHARLAGSATSPAKAAAARENGRRGGRTKRAASAAG